MGILEGLKPAGPVACKLGRIILELEPADREILENALADFNTWSGSGLTKALNERGIDITRDTLHQHRTGRCSCSKI